MGALHAIYLTPEEITRIREIGLEEVSELSGMSIPTLYKAVAGRGLRQKSYKAIADGIRMANNSIVGHSSNFHFPWSIRCDRAGWTIRDARGKCVAMHVPSQALAELLVTSAAPQEGE